MDLSAFNLLMSTTPNAANPADGGVAATGAPAVGTARESLRTGEAFMQLLKTVGSRKTEQNADSFFTAAHARAHADSFKDFKTGENVKVVKISLKRTRACEKPEQPQTRNQVADARRDDDRQKIPAAENSAFAPVDSGESVSAAPVLTIETAESDFRAPAFAPVENKEAPDVEQTAADILINAALQVFSAPVAQEQTPVPAEVETGFAPAASAKPVVENDAEQPAGDSAPLPETRPDFSGETAPEQFSRPVETARTPDVPAGRIETRRESFAPAAAAPVEKRAEKTAPEQNIRFVPTDEAEKVAASVAASDRESAETTEKTVAAPAPKHAETAAVDLPESVGFDAGSETKTVDPAARRQAREIADRLPAGTKLNISVETRVVETAAETVAPVKTEKESRAPRANPDDAALPATPFNDVVSVAEADASAKSFDFEKQPAKSAASRAEAREDAPTADDVSTFVSQTAKTVPTETAGGKSAIEPADGVQADGGSKTAQAFIAGDRVSRGKSADADVKTAQKTVFTREMADTVKINIQKALKAGLDKIDVVLKTKDLGTVKVHLDIDRDGNVKAVISTARADTLDLLRADLSGLKQALADGGFNMGDESFAFNYRGERFDDGGERGRNGGFSNGGGDADETDADAAEDSGLYALNIKV